MTKFTEKDKLKAVRYYFKHGISQSELARKFGVVTARLQYWIRLYEYHGEEAFKRRYTNFSVQDKLNIIQYMNDHGTSIFDTAARFCLPSDSTLWRWDYLWRNQGIHALESKKKGRLSMKNENQKKTTKPTEGSLEALQAENERLRMENAYLKKLNALVQNKEKSPNKTKRK